MKIDPRIQKFVDEMTEAEREMKKLAAQIAEHRLNFNQMYITPLSPGPYERLLPEIEWSLTVRRPDIAVRLINLCEAHEDAAASVMMMTARVSMEAHQETVKAQEEGYPPEYLNESEESPVLRMKVEDGELKPEEP